MTTTPTPDDLFDGADVISRYTRTEAIADGVLVDATGTDEAREAGFKFPVAMTVAAWTDTVAWSGPAIQDETGRLWDVLWMLMQAIRRAGSTDRITFGVYRVPNTGRARTPKLAHLVAVCGPGDDAEPVITIMLPGED